MELFSKTIHFQASSVANGLSELAVRSYRHLMTHGWQSLLKTVFTRLAQRSGWSYLSFVLWEEPLMQMKREEVQEATDPWPEAPWVSVLIDARLGTVKELAYSLRSVELQFWPRTEVCVLYDLEKDLRFEECLQAFIIKHPYTHPHPISGHVASRDSKILLHNLRQSNWWIELEPGDRLAPDFLSRALLSLRTQPELRWIYGDTDLYGFGLRYRPDPKPDWDPIRLLGHNYLQGALLSCSSPEAGESPYSRILRDLREGLRDVQVLHLEGIGVHRRSQTSRTFEASAELEEVREHLKQWGHPARVEPLNSREGWRSIFPLFDDSRSRIAVIIPTRDRVDLLAPCLTGLLEETDERNLEVIVVDNDSQEPATRKFLEHVSRADSRVQVIRMEGRFNYSRLNNQAVMKTDAELLLLLNNDIRILHKDWLNNMKALIQWPQVGAVGAKLLYPNGTIQHAGVTLGAGIAGVAGHTAANENPNNFSHGGRLHLLREVEAATGACLLVKRAAWKDVGGMDESLKVNFNDVDFCLKLRKHGWKTLWNPESVLEHRESASRGHDEFKPGKRDFFIKEVAIMKDRWGAELIPHRTTGA